MESVHATANVCPCGPIVALGSGPVHTSMLSSVETESALGGTANHAYASPIDPPALVNVSV
jgi:hypothetical protein